MRDNILTDDAFSYKSNSFKQFLSSGILNLSEKINTI